MSEAVDRLAVATALPDPMSGFDPTGNVFLFEGRILRGIRSEYAESIRELLKCGLISRLEQQGLFPKTTISDIPLPGFGMTLEHERLAPFVLPSEWSQSMLRDAALALLELNRIAREFGYETKDAHLYNMCFRGTQPMFFDLGSFAPLGPQRPGWRAYDEFVRTVRYPLVLGRQVGPAISRMLLDYNLERGLTHEEFIRFRLGWLASWLPCRLLARAREAYGSVLRLGWSRDGRASQILSRRRWTSALLDRARNSSFFERRTADFRRMQASLRRIRAPAPATGWASYQQGFFDAGGNPILDARFERIGKMLTELQPKSVVELGGNMGAFSLEIYRRGIAAKVTCTDNDEAAIEKAYQLFKKHGEGHCTAAVVDFFEDNRSIRAGSLAGRFRADAVLVLALTHHLVLGRGVQGDVLMRRIAGFCERYAIVEFMPRGLWDGAAPAPPVPFWYTRDWFRQEFLREFELIHEEQLEPNRIVFVGKKLEQSGR